MGVISRLHLLLLSLDRYVPAAHTSQHCRVFRLGTMAEDASHVADILAVFAVKKKCTL